jgi:glutamine amidotransferase
MQLLFEDSEEAPGAGLAFLAGRVRRLRAARLPQMGWNDVEPCAEEGRFDPLFGDDGEPTVVYYANTFVAEPAPGEHVIGHTTYAGERFAAAVRKRNTWGVQFHPEKSAASGLRMIGRFLVEASR